MPSKYYIKTYGCQMNENDSEIIAGILEKKGLVKADDIKEADIIITNTCSVRDAAERKAEGFINVLKKLKKEKPGLIVGVAGCMAERMGEELVKKFKFVDFVMGPNMEQELMKILTPVRLSSDHPSPQSGEGKARSAGVRIGDSRDFKDTSLIKRNSSVNAWITIMEGCDNYCSFCIVPYVRGREKSKPVADILKEIDFLDKSVFKEITLLGQNVNSYAYDFARLLDEVSKIDGIFRVRFMTSHPKNMTDEIIDAVRRNPKVCENFHLPLQSGDDEVLKKMNRGYDSAYYRELVGKIRGMIPEAAITSDVIAGFPGETEKQFENTLRLITELEPDAVNTLAYNVRPSTAAEKMEGKLPQKTVDERLQRLMETVEKTSFKKNQALAGSVQEILVEKKGVGRTRTNKLVKYACKKDETGELKKVRIISAGSWVLQGERID